MAACRSRYAVPYGFLTTLRTGIGQTLQEQYMIILRVHIQYMIILSTHTGHEETDIV